MKITSKYIDSPNSQTHVDARQNGDSVFTPLFSKKEYLFGIVFFIAILFCTAYFFKNQAQVISSIDYGIVENVGQYNVDKGTTEITTDKFSITLPGYYKFAVRDHLVKEVLASKHTRVCAVNRNQCLDVSEH